MIYGTTQLLITPEAEHKEYKKMALTKEKMDMTYENNREENNMPRQHSKNKHTDRYKQCSCSNTSTNKCRNE
jgi:hypothetical protein